MSRRYVLRLIGISREAPYLCGCQGVSPQSLKGPAMDIVDKNKQVIDERIQEGLALLRGRFSVKEQPVNPVLANPVIGARPHHARRFHVSGIGNLLVMTVKDAPENQLSSFVITPYEKDLPLFSTDYVYSGERRFFLIELYDLAVERGACYQQGVNGIAGLGASWDDMADFPARPCWYDGIRPVCIAKAPDMSQDELAVQRFLQALGLYVNMADELPALSGMAREEKWRLNKTYADRLIDEGGVSTDLFTHALGAENTRRFFHEVFFAPACYEPK